MKKIFILSFTSLLTTFLPAQQSIELNNDPPRISLIDKDGFEVIALEAIGEIIQNQNAIKLFRGNKIKLLGSYDSFNFGGYITLSDNNEQRNLELFGDSRFEVSSDEPHGGIWIKGETVPDFFPFPEPAGPRLDLLRLINTPVNDNWGIGIQGSTRGDFPNNFSETLLTFSYNDNEVAHIDENGVYNTVSDRSFKRNVELLPPVMPALMQLNPSTYLMGKSNQGQKNIGFIAQNVREYFPELVKEKHDGTDSYLMLNYSGMIPITVKAVQELKQMVDFQGYQIQSLNNQILELLARIDQLEERLD